MGVAHAAVGVDSSMHASALLTTYNIYHTGFCW